MPIPNDKLTIWSQQGSVPGSSKTYNDVKMVLEAAGTAYASKSIEVFLQGSYGNDTNVWKESDVDIVIRTDDVYYSDVESLTADDKARYDAAFTLAKYDLHDFKRDVTAALVKEYGAHATVGPKAITIAADADRRKTDVIVAAEYRRYHSFGANAVPDFTTGICFFNSSNKLIANYPKLHSANLTTKHKASRQWLKPMIRVLKNFRNKMVDEGVLKAGVAPSYFLEGLLYNVPNDKFGTNYVDSFVNAINWVHETKDRSKFVTANEQYYLLFDGSEVTWPTADGQTFLDAAIRTWNDWK